MPTLRLFDPAGASGAPTVADVILAYISDRTEHAQAGLIHPESLIHAERYLACFGRDYGGRDVSDCRRSDLKQWIGRHPEYRSPHTKAHAVGCVVACFRWAAEDGLIEACPYARPKDLPEREPRAPITEHDVRLILLTVKTHGQYRPKAAVKLRLAIWFLWETGCRPGEMWALKWEHYDDARGVFEIAGKTTKKTGRKRLIVLNHRAWRLIRWLYRRQKPAMGDYVFTNGIGHPWNRHKFSHRFQRYRDLAGVRNSVTPYSLRHGFCVSLLQGGAGERQVADLMGHTNTRLIGWYGRGTRRNVEYLRDTAERRKD